MDKHRLYSQEEDDLIRQYYASMSGRDLADLLGRTVSSVRHRADKIRVEKKMVVRRWTQEEDEFILASQGRKLVDVAKTLGRDTSDTSKRARQLGVKNWRRPDGHFYVDANGYETRFVKGKPVLIHREIVSKAIGRELRAGEIVHHIDCDKTNNTIENLHLFRNPSEHAKCHNSLLKVTDGDATKCKEFLRLGIIHFNADRGIYE